MSKQLDKQYEGIFMKVFSKKQRNKIYKKALDIRLNNDITYNAFVCNNIIMAANLKKQYKIDELQFPELFLFKDNDESGWLSQSTEKADWHTWSDDENGILLRRIVLLFCIGMTS